MPIIITSEGIISPFGLSFIRDSRLELIAPTRDMTDEKETGHGDIDFGTELKSGRIMLHGAIEVASPEERQNFKSVFSAQLLDYLTPQILMIGDDSDKFIYVTLEDKPEITDGAGFVEVNIPLKTDPYWQDVVESSQIGGSTITISGTMDTPVIVIIDGPVTNPTIAIGSSVLLYSGSLDASDKLTIDTDKKTVKFNSSNGLAYFSGGFPALVPGDNAVSPAAGGTTTFKWRNRYL